MSSTHDEPGLHSPSLHSPSLHSPSLHSPSLHSPSLNSPSLNSPSLNSAAWVKSSYGGPTGGNCVELAHLPGGRVAVRNSRDPAGPALVFTPAEWDAFLAGAKDGEFDRSLRLPVAGQCRGTDARADPGEVVVAGYVRRHRIDQVAERPQPDALPHRGPGCRCHVHLMIELHDADRAEHPHVGDPGQPGDRFQPGPQAGLDPGDLGLPAVPVAA